VQLVPVCSPMAAAAALGLLLTPAKTGGVTSTYTMGELEAVLDWADVVVLMKVSQFMSRCGRCCSSGLLGNSWVVERATLPEQVIYSDFTRSP